MDLSLKIAVESAKNLSTEDFIKKYFKPQIPVLIKGVAQEQPAGDKWTIDWFKEEMGDIEIAVFDNNQKKHVYSTTVNPDFKMPFGEFLDLISKDEPSSIRMFRYNLYKQYPPLRQDFSCPRYIARGPMKHFGFMFLGGKDTDVRAHYDVDYSNVFLTQFYGKKRVILFGPENSKYLYQVPFNTHTLADLKHPDYDKFPGLKYVKGYDLIMEEGDGLYMPSGWWHYNTYLNGGISVAFRKLANTPARLWKGLKFVAFTMPFDKIMNIILGDSWYRKKTALCHKRVNEAIRRLKEQNPEEFAQLETKSNFNLQKQIVISEDKGKEEMNKSII